MALTFDSYPLKVFASVVVVIVPLYYFSVKTFNHWKNVGVCYVKPVPFFGNTMLTVFRKKNPTTNQQEIYNTFPQERYVGMFMFRTPILMLRDPQLIHCILCKDFVNFYDRGITLDDRLDLLSQNLVYLRGQKWKSLRYKLTPAFSSGKLKIMSSQLLDCVNTLLEYLEKVTSSKDSYDIREVMIKFSMDVIGSCAFGLQFNSLKDPDSQFRKMGLEVAKPSKRLILQFLARTIHPDLPYYLNLKIYQPHVEQFFLDFVKDAVRIREESNCERKDFIQLLMEARKVDQSAGNKDHLKDDSLVLNDQVLASNAFVFFLAGFETTSSTMSFFLLELAANPDIQERVKNEITKALEDHGGELNYETIKDLQYTEMVISETLRKYPLGTGLLRECTQDYQVPDSSLVLRKGQRVLIPVFSLHHDPTYYPDPERFDPERFAPENKSKIVQGTYLPFGDGPRICMGIRFAMMEMKFAFCKIIPKYEFTMSSQMVYPVKFAKTQLLAPADGIWLDVHHRS